MGKAIRGPVPTGGSPQRKLMDLGLPLAELQAAKDEIDLGGQIEDPIIGMEYTRLWLAVQAVLASR